MKKFTGLFLWLVVMAAIIATLLLSGCMTPQKLKQHALLYYSLHPEEYAHGCADKYPPIVKAGKTITKTDTTWLPGESMPCPEATIDSSTGKPKKDSVHCPGTKIVHDTTSVHDTIINNALVGALQLDLGISKSDMGVCSTLLSGQKEQTKKYIISTIVFSILFGVALIGWIRK